MSFMMLWVAARAVGHRRAEEELRNEPKGLIEPEDSGPHN